MAETAATTGTAESGPHLARLDVLVGEWRLLSSPQFHFDLVYTRSGL